MKLLNRQTKDKIKMFTKHSYIFMLFSTILSCIGIVIKYNDILFPSECTNDWVPYGKYCYYNTNLKLSLEHSSKYCKLYGGFLPDFNNILLKLLYISHGKNFWTSLYKKGGTGTWIDYNTGRNITNIKSVNINKQEDSNFIYDTNTKKSKDVCVIFVGDFLEHVCENINNVICVKEYKKK
ncbi:EV envelope glycoprotein [Cotia virus SPAn232]|uniref:EV envelope glycoprotein n=2 Tax=Cotia virus TaxID=39444 RepID=A0A097IW05_9POXV|nr:EV envelope glycoprotein [Cotia virus SPAn232]ADT91151.1 EV envelope glycoprotein [Cotia virus SPAn232]AIT70756.1 EV envelope glycoprotein [Cotia virus]